MEIELHVERLASERRWNRLQELDAAPPTSGVVLGRFISFRDDDTFVWLHGFRDREERLAAKCESGVRALAPTIGSTITRFEDFARIAESPILEIRQYRVVPGARARFATFLRDRTLAEQLRLGMTIHGPFDDLDDDNILTWFRGFPGLVERDRRKAAFYQGEYWLNELQDEAFSMIEDYSNVMLVTPA